MGGKRFVKASLGSAFPVRNASWLQVSRPCPNVSGRGTLAPSFRAWKLEMVTDGDADKLCKARCHLLEWPLHPQPKYKSEQWRF